MQFCVPGEHRPSQTEGYQKSENEREEGGIQQTNRESVEQVDERQSEEGFAFVFAQVQENDRKHQSVGRHCAYILSVQQRGGHRTVVKMFESGKKGRVEHRIR